LHEEDIQTPKTAFFVWDISDCIADLYFQVQLRKNHSAIAVAEWL
jgi:hypothetical protein